MNNGKLRKFLFDMAKTNYCCFSLHHHVELFITETNLRVEIIA